MSITSLLGSLVTTPVSPVQAALIGAALKGALVLAIGALASIAFQARSAADSVLMETQWGNSYSG